MNETIWDAPPSTFKKKCYICGKEGEIKTADLKGLSDEEIWVTIAFRRWFCEDHYPSTPEREQVVKSKEDEEEIHYQEQCKRRMEEEESLFDD